MKNKRKLEAQELFWKGKFGVDYIKRNFDAQRIKFVGRDLLRNNINVNSVLDLGSNVGHNLDACKLAFPKADLLGVEINKAAFKILKKKHDAINGSILDLKLNKKFDLVIITGVLSHQNQSDIKKLLKKVYSFTKKYIYLADYFNPKPVQVNYRGHQDRLTKDDFAKKLWTLFPTLTLLDYGFYWRHDPYLKSQCDDVNWFLFRKLNGK